MDRDISGLLVGDKSLLSLSCHWVLPMVSPFSRLAIRTLFSIHGFRVLSVHGLLGWSRLGSALVPRLAYTLTLVLPANSPPQLYNSVPPPLLYPQSKGWHGRASCTYRPQLLPKHSQCLTSLSRSIMLCPMRLGSHEYVTVKPIDAGMLRARPCRLHMPTPWRRR